jgi:hypothetical protein
VLALCADTQCISLLLGHPYSVQDIARELQTFLWPEGTHARSGRAWESLESATEEITSFMRTQGCRGLKIKNQTYFDAVRTRVKKRVFKCPCSGVYTPRAVESIAVGGRARQTSTKITNFGSFSHYAAIVESSSQYGNCRLP